MYILLIEDDADLAAVIGAFLEGRGHTVDYAADGVTGLRLSSQECVDAVVLDFMLPGMDGLKVCSQMRESSGRMLPILMLTARDTLEDKLAGFAAGADDYLIKPFSVKELEARLLALHGRAAFSSRGRLLKVADLEFNLDTQCVKRGEQMIQLRPAPRKLLEILMRSTHRIVSPEEMEQALWPEGEADRDALRVHLHMLRKEIEQGEKSPLLHTVRGSGYRLCEPDAP